MNQPKTALKTTKLSILPFKNMNKIRSHTSRVFDCASVLFPSGKIKIITCSTDCTLQIFDLETLKCEEIIKHFSRLFSVHYYKEKQLLMTTDWDGKLCFWNLFSSRKKIIKRIKISKPESSLWKLTQISSNLFFCCVSYGYSKGSLYSIEFKNLNEIKINEINYPLINNRKERLRCIYKLKSEKKSILFSGGYSEDYTIKKFNFKTKKHSNFPKKHSDVVLCLTSYFNEEYEEIVLSGSKDMKVLFWTLNGQNIKEIKLNGYTNCYLNDFKRNNIYIATGYPEYCLYSLNLKTLEIKKNVENINSSFINSLKWINEENQNSFISCSDDRTFSIFELEKLENKYENKDLKERVSFIKDEEFLGKKFCSEDSNKMIFSVKLLNSVEIRNIFKVFLL